MEAVIQVFPREDGTISIWDHPNFKSSMTLPDQYTTLTRLNQGLETLENKHERGLMEKRLTVLKVVGDAVCANENQLRRYLSKVMSFSETSDHLKYLRKYGFVERHTCRLAFTNDNDEHAVKPPAPHTLGLIGYIVMNHFYGGQFFKNPNGWQQNSLGIQRYTAMNEIRCLAVESRKLRGWTWHPYIGGKTKYKRPLAVAKIETPQGELQMFFERAQMSLDFIGYFRERLETFRYLQSRDGFIRIDQHAETKMQMYVLSCSTVSMANFIQEQLHLHTYPFEVLLQVDEWMETPDGLGSSFASVSKEGIKRLSVAFLNKAEVPVR
ncbi:MAG: hypothetical protein R3267_02340 [Paenisporosarcina sp.]|nr:hypothetical protein [Paenisporosarcina sp.]